MPEISCFHVSVSGLIMVCSYKGKVLLLFYIADFKLYIEGNNFKLIRFPDIVELAEVVISSNIISIIHELNPLHA